MLCGSTVGYPSDSLASCVYYAKRQPSVHQYTSSFDVDFSWLRDYLLLSL